KPPSQPPTNRNLTGTQPSCPQTAAITTAKAAQAKAQSAKKPTKGTTPAPVGLLRPAFSDKERRVVIVTKTTNPALAETAPQALAVANTAIRAVSADPNLIFTRAYASKPSFNLVLETGPSVSGSHFEPFADQLQAAFSSLDIVRIDFVHHWSTFLVHSIPTTLSIAQIKSSFQTNYPQILLEIGRAHV